MTKKTKYLLFCSKCGMPQHIPVYIISTYFKDGVEGVFCRTCGNRTVIPEYLKKLKEDL